MAGQCDVSMPKTVTVAVVVMWIQGAGNGFNAARVLLTWSRRPAIFDGDRMVLAGLAVSVVLCTGLAVCAIAVPRRGRWARDLVLGFEVLYGLSAVLPLVSGHLVALPALCAAVAVIVLLLLGPAENWFAVETK